MKILDGLPRNREEAKAAAELGAAIIAKGLSREKLTPKQQSIVDLLGEGLSLADILGVSAEERAAVLAQAGQILKGGNVKGAQDLLIELVKLEPTDEASLHMLGLTFQLQGHFSVAGKLFLQAIALDASKQDPYLRLGECFMANHELESARGCFEAAQIDLGGGPPHPDTRQQAARMLAALDGRALPRT